MDEPLPQNIVRFTDLDQINSGSLTVGAIIPVVVFDTGSLEYVNQRATFADVVSLTSAAVGIGSFVTTSSFSTFTASIDSVTSSFVTTTSLAAENFVDQAGLDARLASYAQNVTVNTLSQSIVSANYVTSASYNALSSSFLKVGDFNNATISFVTHAQFNTGSFVNTSSFNSFTSSVSSSYLLSSEFHNFTTSLLTIANTASYVSVTKFNAYTSSNNQTFNNLTSSFVTQTQLNTTAVFIESQVTQSATQASGNLASTNVYLTASLNTLQSQINSLNVFTGSVNPPPSSVVLNPYTASVFNHNSASVPWYYDLSGSIATLQTEFATLVGPPYAAIVFTSSFNAYTASQISRDAGQDSTITTLSSSLLTYIHSVSNSLVSSDVANFNFLQNEIVLLQNFSQSITFSTGAYTTTKSFNQFTQSFNIYTGSVNFLTSSYVNTASYNRTTSSFVSTSSFNIYTASVQSEINSLNAFTASLVFPSTGSLVTTSSFGAFTASVYVNFVTESQYLIDSGSWTRAVNALNLYTASLVFPAVGSFVTTSSFGIYTASLNLKTSSFVTNSQTSSFVTTSSFGIYTASVNASIASLNAFTASITFPSTASLVLSSSFNQFTSSVVTTSSFGAFTASYKVDSSSLASGVSSLNAFTASITFPSTGSFVTTSSFNSFTSSVIGAYVNTSSFNSFTASYKVDSSSILTKIANLSSSFSSSLASVSTSFQADLTTIDAQLVSLSAAAVRFTSVTQSITASGAFIQLVNDITIVSGSATNYYYGSNTSGIKGWYALGSGTGDMTKAVYDPSNHGYVDTASISFTASYAQNVGYGNILETTSSYIIQSVDYTILVNAVSTSILTIYLPTSSLNDKKVINVKRIDSVIGNQVNVVVNTNDTIYQDRVTSSVNFSIFDSNTFHSDGKNNRWISL